MGKRAGRIGLAGRRLPCCQTDLPGGHGKSCDRIHHQQDVLALISKEFADGGSEIGPAHPYERRRIRRGCNDDGSLQTILTEVSFNKLPDFPTPLSNKRNHIHIRLRIPGHHPQQDAFAHAGSGHDGRALALGKGDQAVDHSQGGAAIARKVLSKKGFKLKDIETVSFLIEKHLFLIKTATRRDIHDEETSIFCARTIKEIDRLKMLYLLTVADSMATGPKAWNDWIQTLLRDLFLKVLNVLKKGELASREAVKAVEKKKYQILSQASSPESRKDLKELFNVFSPRYLLYAHTNKIMEDIKLYESLGEKDFIWDITKSDHANTRVVKICAKDRPGIFSSISGIFTLNNIDIIDAQIFTWRNRIALDIFNVKPPPEQLFEDERWERAEKNLQSALSGNLDLAKSLSEKMMAYRSFRTPGLIRPHRIVIDNDSSSFFTIIEVFTYDFPGLLFNITDALFRSKLDIWVAKIATKADQVVDVFYVRDFDGQRVDSPDQVAAIKATIEKRLPEAGSN